LRALSHTVLFLAYIVRVISIALGGGGKYISGPLVTLLLLLLLLDMIHVHDWELHIHDEEHGIPLLKVWWFMLILRVQDNDFPSILKVRRGSGDIACLLNNCGGSGFGKV
jgi:hypothetical protein